MNRARTVIVLVMLTVLAVTLLTGAVLTRGVMAVLPFLQDRKGSWTGAYVPLGIVDQRPWQTSATLAALAQSAEEKKFARDADRKSTRLNSSHRTISYAVFCLKKKK